MKVKLTIHPNIKVVDPGHIVMPVVLQLKGVITEDVAANFANDWHAATNSGQPVIPIMIDTLGGDVYAALAIADLIKTAEVPVATIVCGKAMSAGAFILSCGTEGFRFASPNSTLMIHEASISGMEGKFQDIQIESNELSRVNKSLLEQQSLNCGKPKDYFEKFLKKKKNVDFYMTPEEAIKHGLINEIRLPEMNIKVDIVTEFK